MSRVSQDHLSGVRVSQPRGACVRCTGAGVHVSHKGKMSSLCSLLCTFDAN